MIENSETNLEIFKEIDVKKPSDIIINQIKNLISTGKLKPGVRLPSERVLSERFGVGRSYVREAIKKLEFYGILKTIPQKGTIVASLGVKALEGLIANILNVEGPDFESLMEVRALLEVQSARLAAARAEEGDVQSIVKAQEDFRREIEAGRSGLEEDHLFHLRIAEASKNMVLRSLIGLITPDIIAFSRREMKVSLEREHITLTEHDRIIKGIKTGNPERAASAMEEHMQKAHERRLAHLNRGKNTRMSV
ncbi:MAG: GntR family transcriptional regulator [Spirochaetes bacterium]|nr:MAG: GntR family transcriptional regulator [Spirochaetota bacterium]